MLKSLGNDKTLISCDVRFRFYCYSVFYPSEDCQKLNMAKSKELAFKISRNGEVFLCKLDIWLKTYFYMLCSSYTCCTFHIGSGLVAW